MAVAVADVIKDLLALRKGRGLYATDLADRLGPALRAVCGVDDAAGPSESRSRVEEHLEQLAGRLPDDLRIAVLAALGIAAEARLPFYQDRIRWLAARLGRDERTVRRRIDDGIRQLAQLAVPQDAAESPECVPDVDWHTEELRATLVLDRDTPVAFLHRCVVAHRDGLDRLDLAFTVTNPRGESGALTAEDLVVEVMFGGELAWMRMESSDRFGIALDLPHPLRRNDKHTFALQTRLPEGKVMQPHYVCVPTHRCDLFELRVRFDAAGQPYRVWRLDGVYQRDIDDPEVRGEAVPLNRVGEMHLVFHQLRTDRAYGARWDAANSAAEAGR
jgi:hypothetical protein